MLSLIVEHLRDGRFQTGFLLLTAIAGLLSGLEVAIEHYRGSYNQKIMWSPLAFSVLLAGTALAAIVLPAARAFLPFAGLALALDGATGFVFHIRGIARKPGGWCQNLITNIVMGPPLFAPLLLAIGGVMALLATRLLPESADTGLRIEQAAALSRQFAGLAVFSAALNGFEVLYSHYKSGFTYIAQWLPVLLTPLLILAPLAFLLAANQARGPLLAVSATALLTGALGSLYHLRGVLRRPGDGRQWFYKLVYGPPLFAPLLFSATGLFGLLAAFLGSPA